MDCIDPQTQNAPLNLLHDVPIVTTGALCRRIRGGVPRHRTPGPHVNMSYNFNLLKGVV